MVAILSPLLIGFGKVAFAISSIISLVGTVGPVIAGLAGPIGIAIGVIGALVAAGIFLYRNWDTIKAKANALKNNIVRIFNQIKAKVASIWNSIKTAIVTPINAAVNTVKTAIGKIKSVINGAKLKLPHIKLPHFSISGKFSLTPPSIPKINVSWYRKAENDPYMFGNATLFGAGERNDEMLYGHDALMRDIREAAGGGGNTVTINVTVNGADNPEDWARRLARQMQLEMRTI